MDDYLGSEEEEAMRIVWR